MKKSKIILIALGALLLVGALVFGILMLTQSANTDSKSADQTITLYWNVERADYAGGHFARSPRGDGCFYVRFAVGGEQVDIPVATEELINKVDHLDVMGLVFNEDGVAVDVKNINECTGGLVANVLYVESIEGNTVHCNNQGMYRGQKFDLELTENTQVYDVGQQGLLCGIASQIAEDDELMAIRDYDGNLIYIYRKAYQEPGDVYWNLDRKYDSTNRISTRPYDSLGTYEFRMALNGEIVTVRTRDMAIANAIDAKAAKCTGLEFDEDGFVVKVTSAVAAAKGSSTFASWAHVFETDGTNVYAVKLSGSAMGTEYTASIAKNCKIINVSGIGGELGSYTTIQYGDQIHGILDNRGRICYAWVVSRLAGDDGYKLYWNVERQYDSTLKETKRTPSADGYYYIEVATDGHNMIVKTKDKEMATKLDSYAARCFSMKITEDNEIVAFASAGAIHGGATFGSWYYVDKIDGQKVTVSRVLAGDTEPTVVEGVMTQDIQVINGSLFYTNNPGEYTTLKVGDRVHGLKNLDGEVAVLFVVDRVPNVPIYWNLVRKYDSKEKASTREPAADGYYYFEMAVNGKQVTVKTNDKEIAKKIDAAAARCMGLLVDKNGVVKKYFAASTVEGYQGSTKHQSWVDVTKINGKTFTAQKDPNSTADTAGQYFTSTMAANCKIYNVSSNYKQFCGEATTLQIGDRIHALHNKDGYATIVFVVERAKTLDEKDPCPCQSNVKWQPWDGKTPLENGKSYYLTQDVVAPDDGFLMDGLSVNLRLDGHTISSKGRCFYVKSSAKLNICDHTTCGMLIGNGVKEESGGVIRVSSSSCIVNLWNIDMTSGDAPVAKEGGLISNSGTVSLYDCNLTGGKATIKSGNIQLNSGGTLRVFGGTIANGSAPSAANINAIGRMYLENVSVIGSGAFTCNSDKEIVINGLSADNMYITKNCVTFQGNMQLKKLTMRDDTSIVDGGIYPDSKILLVCKPEKSQVVMTSATEAGYKALTSFDPDDYVLSYDRAKKTVSVTNTIVPQTHTNSHCACAGVAKGVGEHTCKELTNWTLLTADVLVASSTDGNLAFPASGNYYLSVDLELTKSIDILPGQEITLCLNSCELTSTNRIFRINGTLNVTDCQNKGGLIGKAALAPVFYTYAGGTFNLFAGTVSSSYAGNASYWGGIGYLSNDKGNAKEKAASTMNMYGGTILGGNVTQNADGKYGQGGALIVASSTTFNMYGGVIKDGNAEVRGGNVYATGGCTVNLLGGSIMGGSALDGGDIYMDAKAKITMGGKLQIGEAYLTGGFVKLQNLDQDSRIGIRVSDPVVFAESEKDLSKCFYSVDSAYYVTYKNGELALRQSGVEGTHVHCFCGDTAVGAYNHDCDRIAYEPWTSNNSLPTESGSYYLTDDVVLENLASGLKVGTKKINICLNGYNITNEKGRVFYLDSAGYLMVCNCDSTKGGVVSGNGVEKESGGVIRVASTSAVVKLCNIDLVSGDAPIATEGGLLSCSGTVSLYDCNLTGGKATEKGGNIQLNSGGTLRVYGCTIANGSAPSAANINAGGKMYLENVSVIGSGAFTCNSEKEIVINGLSAENMNIIKNSVTFQGNLQLKKLTLRDDTSIVDGGIATDSKILLVCTPEKSQVVMTSATEAGYKALTSFDPDDYVLSYDRAKKTVTITNTIVPQTHTNSHCACAGVAKGVGEHTCKELTNWTLLTEDILVASSTDGNLAFPASGNYYLSVDLELTKSIDILPGQEITLCLNSCELTSSKRIFRINGTLNVTDCQNKGELIGKTALAPVFYTYAGGTFNLFAGTVSTSYTGNASYWGGIGYLSNDPGNATEKSASTMNMYGGTILGGNVIQNADGKDGQGGALTVAFPNTFNMYGGVIKNGNAAVRGGNVCAIGACTVNLLGGSIMDGIAPDGGDIYFDASAKVTMGGKLQIDEVYLAGGAMKLQNLDQDSRIGIRMSEPGVFAESEKDLTKCFHSVDSAYYVDYKNGQMALKQPIAEDAHAHCICGDTAVSAYDHDCDRMAYEPWTASNSLPTQSGNYYLTSDVVLEDLQSGLKIGTKKINICLNGYNITNENGRVFYLDSTGSLNVCNCDTTKGGIIGGIGVEGESGGVVRVSQSSGKFGAYNVTLRRIDTETRTAVTEGGVINCSGYLWLYNAKVENGYATKGGNVNLVLTSKAQIVGCIITGGSAAKFNGGTGNGGNILVSGNNNDNPATLLLVDSTVSQGKAEGSGAGIYLADGADTLLKLGGNVQIVTNDTHNLYMVANDNLALMDLSADARIGISQKNVGVIVQTQTDLKDCFISDAGIPVYHDGQQLVMGYRHDGHCVCAGNCVEVGDHTCNSDITWQAFTTDILEATSSTTQVQISQSGNFYLTDNVTLDKEIVIPTGVEVSICLNGHTISGSRRIFRVNGVVNITDCSAMESGAVEGSATLAPVFYGYAGGTINLYGGTLRSTNNTPNSRYWGGVGALSNDKGMASATAPSAMNMYGGKIEGTSVIINSSNGRNGNGGAIAIMAGSTFTMYGGQIVGGSAELGGAAVSVDNISKALLLGGSVVAGAQEDKLVYCLTANSKITVGGDAVVSDIYLTGTLQISQDYPLTDGAWIGVSSDQARVVANVAEETLVQYFHATQNRCQIQAKANGEIFDVELKTGVHPTHCVCAGYAEGMGDHTCNSDITWQAFTTDLLQAHASNSNYVQITQSGHYYLTGDLTLSKEIVIGPGVEVTICLNGCKITDSRRIFRVNGVLNITDCSEEETGLITGTTALAPVFYGYANGRINLFAGTLRSSNTSSGRYWGGVCALANDKGEASATAPSSFYMYGGTIEGTSVVINTSNNKYGSGGALTIMGGSTFTMFGGQIIGGSAQVTGAAVYVDNNGTAYLLGGSIVADTQEEKLVGTGNNSKVILGGDIHVDSFHVGNSCTVTLSKEYPMTEDAYVGITLENGTGTLIANIGEALPENLLKVFEALEEGRNAAVEDDSLKIQ